MNVEIPLLMSDQPSRICILGGGFGGLYTALRLSELPWESSQKPEIVLIDKNDRFLFSPLLYELVTGEVQSWEIAPPFAELLADTGVKFHQDYVTGLDIPGQKVQLASHAGLNYDKLVIALGGTTPLDIVPGARSHAIGFRTLEDAYRLGEKLRELEQSSAEKIRVALVGGGYSGVELGCKLADRLGKRGRIRIIERGETILKTSPEFNRQVAMRALEERLVWLDLETAVQEVSADSISLSYKGQVDTIPVDLVLWSVGNQVSQLLASLPLKQNASGRLTANTFLQSVDSPDIYVLGDGADCRDARGQQVPATAQVAIQQSDYCAWNLWASHTGRPLLPFQYQALGEMMTLGADSAAISGLGIKLDGLLAYLSRRLVYLYRLPTWKHQLTVGLNWMTRPLLELFAG
jgi:NADH dehydrogenase